MATVYGGEKVKFLAGIQPCQPFGLGSGLILVKVLFHRVLIPWVPDHPKAFHNASYRLSG